MKKIVLFILLTIFGFMQTKAETRVRISTSYGDMIVKLYDETPKHRDNFVKLVKDGFYEGTLFHRVINSFMIQGGDPDSKNAAKNAALGAGDIGYRLPAEFVSSKIHKKGALAAARQGDFVNPKKESSGCQFYIVQGNVYKKEHLQAFENQMGKKFSQEQIAAYTTVGGTPHLDGEYTVFGEVVEGLDVIDRIAAVQTDGRDRPLEDIKMNLSIE